jgi:hypothetical protein
MISANMSSTRVSLLPWDTVAPNDEDYDPLVRSNKKIKAHMDGSRELDDIVQREEERLGRGARRKVSFKETLMMNTHSVQACFEESGM